jgi:hypothetical protein
MSFTTNIRVHASELVVEPDLQILIRGGEPSCAGVPFLYYSGLAIAASFCHVLLNPKQDAAGTIKRFGNEVKH